MMALWVEVSIRHAKSSSTIAFAVSEAGFREFFRPALSDRYGSRADSHSGDQ